MLAALGFVLLSACDSDATMQKPSNAATNDAVNALSANITEHDGADAPVVPVDAQSVGQSMRSAATKPPR